MNGKEFTDISFLILATRFGSNFRFPDSATGATDAGAAGQGGADFGADEDDDE